MLIQRNNLNQPPPVMPCLYIWHASERMVLRIKVRALSLWRVGLRCRSRGLSLRHTPQWRGAGHFGTAQPTHATNATPRAKGTNWSDEDVTTLLRMPRLLLENVEQIWAESIKVTGRLLLSAVQVPSFRPTPCHDC
jgi:hypothetical protein